MATLRELKGRIGSVASSEKITGAMKMISSAKMHKAEQALKRQLPFRNQIETIIANLLSADAQFASPLLDARDVKHVSIVVLGSDDGLCGAYNVNIFKQLLERIQHYRSIYGDDVKIKVIPVGAKMIKAANKVAHTTVSEAIDGIDSKTEADGVKAFMAQLQQQFLAGDTDLVDVLYMNFKSVSRQRPRFEQILPVVQESFMPEGAKIASARPYLFEPDVNQIFSSVLPLFLLSTLQEIFTENRASEQAARVMAMQSANDNAKKLLDQLRLEYNKLRQQSITNELLDIVGGQVR